ncbi:hypothetical protein EJ02DRAFT_301132, partial [Clathrospora elynae]
ECRRAVDHVNGDVVAVNARDFVRSVPAIALSPYQHLALQRERKHVCSIRSVAGVQGI